MMKRLCVIAFDYLPSCFEVNRRFTRRPVNLPIDLLNQSRHPV
jgi:hypothetical protein